MTGLSTLITDTDAASMQGLSIGKGTARECFEVQGCPDRVVKVMLLPIPASNFMEWFIWSSVRESEFSKRFGKCFQISESGRYLIMERIDDLVNEQVPDDFYVPAWVNDRKPSALGRSRIDGEIKVRDYGLINEGQLLNLKNLVAWPQW